VLLLEEDLLEIEPLAFHLLPLRPGHLRSSPQATRWSRAPPVGKLTR
jgi:hypothetical protein